MSLDRGFAPQTALVNYGGGCRTPAGDGQPALRRALQDFSQGIDIVEGADVRARVRAAVRLPDAPRALRGRRRSKGSPASRRGSVLTPTRSS